MKTKAKTATKMKPAKVPQSKLRRATLDEMQGPKPATTRKPRAAKKATPKRSRGRRPTKA